MTKRRVPVRRATHGPPQATPRGSGVLLLAVFLAGTFAVKLVIFLQLKDHILLQPSATDDAAAYVGLAGRVLAGNPALGPGMYYVSPLYIYFLALVLWITRSLDAVRVVQLTLGTVAIGLIYATADEWFGRRAAWLAAMFTALTGLISFYEVTLIQASLDPILTATLLYCWTLALRREDRYWYFLAGFAFALLSLNRPNALIAAVGVSLLLLLCRRWAAGSLIALGLLVGLAPLGIRNVLVAGEWSLVPSHGGLNLYIGNSPSANGFFRIVPGVGPTIEGQAHDTRRVAEAALHRPLTDSEVSAYFSHLAWQWIRSHPVAWFSLFARKFGYVFNAQHIALPLSYPFFALDTDSVLRFLRIGPWLVIPLGLLGLALPQSREIERSGEHFPNSQMAYLIWVSFVPCYAFSVALFFVSERYRLPLLVPLFVGVGAAVDRLIGDVTARAGHRLWKDALFLLIALVACNWPLDMLDGDGRGEERVHMAENLAHIGRADEARSWVTRALESYPYASLAHYRVGVQFANTEQWASAIAELSEALRLDPSAPAVELALGQALNGSGRFEDAIPHLRKAMDGQAEIHVAGLELASALESTSDPGTAVEVLRDLATRAPGDLSTSLQLGRLAVGLGALDVAQSFFAQAVMTAPDSVDAHEQAGLNLVAQKRYAAAADEFSEAVRVDSRRTNSLVSLASCEIQLGRLDLARSHLTAALALDPLNPAIADLKRKLDLRHH